jgi:transposase
VAVRGDDQQTGHMFSYLSPEQRVPKDHPLRAIRTMTDAALRDLSPRFDAIYARIGRPSVPPEKLLRALLLQVLYTIRGERLLMEELHYNLLFRWFVGLNLDDPVWTPTTFSKNRDRLLDGDIAAAFFDAVRTQARAARLLSDEHFTVDGSLLEAWAGQKSFKPREAGPGAPPDDPGNPTVNFRGETRRNDTHGSTTDPDAQLYRKANGQESKLAFLGHILLDNRHGLVANSCATAATGTAEREAAVMLVDASAAAGQHARGRQGLRRRELRGGRPRPGRHAPRGAEAPRECDRRPHDATRRLRNQSAEAEAGRTGVGLDEDGRLAAQAAASRRGACGLGAYLYRHGVQPDTHAQPGGDVSLTGGEWLDRTTFRPHVGQSVHRFAASIAWDSFVNSRSSSPC